MEHESVSETVQKALVELEAAEAEIGPATAALVGRLVLHPELKDEYHMDDGGTYQRAQDAIERLGLAVAALKSAADEALIWRLDWDGIPADDGNNVYPKTQYPELADALRAHKEWMEGIARERLERQERAREARKLAAKNPGRT